MGTRPHRDLRSSAPRYALILWLAVLWVLGHSQWARPAILKVGLADEPKTLNPFAASDIWALKVLNFCYQPLYYPDPVSDQLIPWLAAHDPIWEPENKTVTIRLREALWDDGSPFTAEDVVYTAKVIRRFRIPSYWNEWQPVREVEALDPHTVRMALHRPIATLWERTLTTRIMQKSRWRAVFNKAEEALQGGLQVLNAQGKEAAEVPTEALVKPLQIISSHFNARPESLGPFSFEQWQRGAFLYLKRNERFFALNGEIRGHPVGPHVDGIIFKIYRNMDLAILALKRGDIDYLWWGLESGYFEDLKRNPNIKIFSVPGLRRLIPR